MRNLRPEGVKGLSQGRRTLASVLEDVLFPQRGGLWPPEKRRQASPASTPRCSRSEAQPLPSLQKAPGRTLSVLLSHSLLLRCACPWVLGNKQSNRDFYSSQTCWPLRLSIDVLKRKTFLESFRNVISIELIQWCLYSRICIFCPLFDWGKNNSEYFLTLQGLLPQRTGPGADPSSCSWPWGLRCEEVAPHGALGLPAGAWVTSLGSVGNWGLWKWYFLIFARLSKVACLLANSSGLEGKPPQLGACTGQGHGLGRGWGKVSVHVSHPVLLVALYVVFILFYFILFIYLILF